MFAVVPKGLIVLLDKAPGLAQGGFRRVIVRVVTIVVFSQGEVAVGRGSGEHLAWGALGAFGSLGVWEFGSAVGALG